jgi:hypothetical protein
MRNVVTLRSKVVEIQAMQFIGGAENATPVIDWILNEGGSATWTDAYEAWESEDGTEGYPAQESEAIRVKTLEGIMDAKPGSWIFRGLEGEFYPCKDSVKIAKYDEVN